ncbi:MAG TPA: PD-(D/E)XK nuclease family protein [Clostridium sp.]|uniref:PD-(D/E)XK nuclease family protein n=1 Tax=Clostridium sp. TaxID=1506 RepID=UPI002F94D95C
MARKTGEQLEAIKKKFNVSKLWSWSRYNNYKNSSYEYYLKYIAKIKEDRDDGIYGVSGNGCHTILENFYSKKIKYEDMLQEYENALFTYNAGELKYDRTNEEKNRNIAKKYENSIRHFFQHHDIINNKCEIEKFITIRINSFVFQGYVDFMHKEDGCFIITDWKTSSIYTGKKINKEKGQLVLYAEGIKQLGVPLEKIKIRWDFLKYVIVEVEQANGKITQRNIARNEIGSSLVSNAKMWLKKEKCYSDEEVDSYLELLSMTNDLSCLPENVQSKYNMKDCFVYIPFTQEEIDNLKSNIVDTIVEISKKEGEYDRTQDENVWWEEITDVDSYFFANLSGYSSFLHKPYAEYLSKRKSYVNSVDSKEEDDLSWMEGLLD